MTKQIINDLKNGNPKGDGYTIKEILTAHIRHNDETHEKLFEELKVIRAIFASKKMVVGMFSSLTALIGFLAYHLFK